MGKIQGFFRMYIFLTKKRQITSYVLKYQNSQLFCLNFERNRKVTFKVGKKFELLKKNSGALPVYLYLM